MPTYTYKARDARGRSLAGGIDAASEHLAIQQLREDGLSVTEIRLTSALVNVEALRIKQASKSVKREEVISFSSQLSVMLETGVPLSESLDAYLAQSRQTGIRRIVEIVADRIHSGVSFSAAISEFPKSFPPLMISLLRASEAAGALDTMLGRIADYLVKERRTLKQIKGALMYPVVMISMAVIVTVFLVGWVLPKFARIYESRAASLPKPTQILLSVSGFITTYWPWLLGALIASVAFALVFRRTETGIRCVDWLKIRMPIIGPIFTNFYLTRSTRTLSTLLASGVTFPDAVDIVRDLTGNVLWRDLWDDVKNSMTAGRPVTETLLASDLVPASIAQMIAAGERTGQLPMVLDRIATVCEEDLEEAIKNSTQMIEPIVITVMGGLIGGIAIALLLPIFTMGSAIGHG